MRTLSAPYPGPVSPTPPQDAPRPGALTLAVRSDRIVLAGLGLWAIALLLVLLVPSWHEGERGWWPWACVSGLALGVLGWVYLRRGRGNAAEANDPVSVPPAAAEKVEAAQERVEQVRQRRSGRRDEG
ncbi:hypothetical protein GCM10027055_04000 [Janibacter alkaliphilus]|mgnify:CR=1 FL=1